MLVKKREWKTKCAFEAVVNLGDEKIFDSSIEGSGLMSFVGNSIHCCKAVEEECHLVLALSSKVAK